jgi:hypothetical protein
VVEQVMGVNDAERGLTPWDVWPDEVADWLYGPRIPEAFVKPDPLRFGFPTVDTQRRAPFSGLLDGIDLSGFLRG